MRSLLLCLILASICFSCSEQHEISNKVLNIFEDNEIIEGYNYSEFLEYEDIIYLESTIDSYIGQIDKIILSDDKLFILDKYISKAVFVFNLDGSFDFKINLKGKGPGEFGTPVDIDIAEDKIHLLSASPRKIIQYDLFGKYQKEIYLNPLVPGTLFSFMDGKYILYTMNHKTIHMEQVIDYNYCVFNDQGKLIEKYLNQKSVNRGFSENILHNNAQLRKFNGEVILTLPASDTIFSYNGIEVSSKYIADFGNKTIPKNYFKSVVHDQHDQLSDSQYAHSITNTFVDKNNIFFQFTAGNRVYSYLSNFSRDKSVLASGLMDDIYYAFPRFMNYCDHRIIACLTPSQLSYNINYGQEKGWIPKDNSTMTNRIINNVTDESNPIIFLLKFK